MAAHCPPFWVAALFLASLDLWCSSSSPPCPTSCTCPRAPQLNCSSSGLSSVPQLIQDSITDLDLSHNLLSYVTFNKSQPSLRNLWLGNNSIPSLSLCIERTIRGERLRLRSATGDGSRSLTWAPALQLLSAERNLLQQLPEGLNTVESLKILQLSFNRITRFDPGVLSSLHQLRELHLQHNLITHIHPQIFQNLDQLRVLDLSFNRLKHINEFTYLSLRNLGAEVKLGGNRWRCDCNIRGIRRRMAYDSNRGLQTWNIVCEFPTTLSGKHLLQLDEEDLQCLSTENNQNLHQDVTVYSGTEILLSCAAQESEWWTPRGRASVNQHEAHLLISDFSEGDTGLYVCVSEEDQVLSVFNLQISKTGGARKARSLPRVDSKIFLQETKNNMDVKTTQSPTHSDLALAICLSILFTFLLAFILGVLARPCIDRLWRRVTKKKDPPETHTVTSAQQRDYENQAFSNMEEQEAIESHRERRVTFSSVEFTGESNVQYYDTVANGDQESIRSDVFEYREAEVDLHRRPEENDSSSAELNLERFRNMKFEHIPDQDDLEEKRSLSSSSDSSQSSSEVDQITTDQTLPKSPQLVEDTLQKRAALSTATKKEITQVSESVKSEFNISSCPQANKAYLKGSDVSQDDGELFEFSDVAQSPSGTVSPQVQQVKNGNNTKWPGEALDSSSSSDSDSSDSNRKPMHKNIKQKIGKKQKTAAVISKLPTGSSSSNSESEEKMINIHVKDKINTEELPFQDSRTKNYYSGQIWPAVDLQKIPQLRRRLDIKVLLSSFNSRSSSENSEDEPRGHVTKKTRDELMMARGPTNVTQPVNPMPENLRSGFKLKKASIIKGTLEKKVPTADSDSSISSDSEDETIRLTVKEKPGGLDVGFQGYLPKRKALDGSWPVINLSDLPNIKRRLDFRAPPTTRSDSSSDSEDQTRGNVIKQKKENLLLSKLETEVSTPIGSKPETESDSSSSSDSDNERKDSLTKQKREELLVSKRPTIVTTAIQKPESHWPALNFGGITKLKRRLDIKAPTVHSDSSSSPGSEDKTSHVMKQKQEDLLMSKFPNKISPTVYLKPENRWPSTEFGKTELKTPLDIRGQSTESDSSTSSDSDNERKDNKTKPKQEQFPVSKHTTIVTKATQKPESQWPALEFGRITKIKRRLDIKAPKVDSDSSSSTDSEDETSHVMKQKQEGLLMSKFPNKVSSTVHPKQENRWPPPEFEKTTELKKPLDIRAQSTDSDSSSSSDSDNERKDNMTKQYQEELLVSSRPTIVTTATQKPESQWPALDFGRLTKNKRRLDIKAPTVPSDSSSSTDSEDETSHVMKQKQEDLLISKFPTKVSPTVHPKPENRWPPPEFGKTTELKKPAQSTESDSSSSSDSDGDNERKDSLTKQKQDRLLVSKLPTIVSTATQKPESQWPALDFGRKTKIKRRLDIKAPTVPSDSSSNTDSENETSHVMKQKQEDLLISKVPSKVSPTVRPKPENRWPPAEFGKKELKTPLDIRAQSTESDSSTSSDSDNERKDNKTKPKQEQFLVSKHTTNVNTATQKPESQWPALEFGRITKIKRRLDIKAPTMHSDSSSSCDSKDATSHVMKQKQEDLLMSKLPNKVSPTVHPKPENRWPPPEVGKTTELKKPAKATDSDSSSSSDSDGDNERKDSLTKQKQDRLLVSKLPTIVSTATQKPERQWPALDFGRKTKIKRRLDIKAPTVPSDSSSSTDSEDETSHVMKQKQEDLLISKLPNKVSPTVHPKPENRWPPPEVGKTTELKKPAKATDSDSSSSSDSDGDNERKDSLTKQKQDNLLVSKRPTIVTTATQKPERQWPALDFGGITKLNRRLDIKAPTVPSDSSYSTDSENETSHVMKQKQEDLLISKVPSKVSPTVRPKAENRWPPAEFGKTELKTPLDIRAQSTESDSSTSSDSDNERKDNKTKPKQEQLLVSKHTTNVNTATQKPESQWPALDFGRITKIKSRLDIKAPTVDSDSSSSSDSEDETRHVMKQKKEDLLMSNVSTKVSPSVRPKPEYYMPSPEFGKTTELMKPLDIKAQSTDSDSSPSSDSGNKRKGQITKQKQEEFNISNIPTNVSTQKQGNQWPSLDLWRTTQFKRRLDIKAPTADSDSSSNSDSENKAGHFTETSKPKKPDVHLSFQDITKVKTPLDTTAPSSSSDSSSCSSSEDEKRDFVKKQLQEKSQITKNPADIARTVSPKPENEFPTLDLGQMKGIKKRLDIKTYVPDKLSLVSNDSVGMTIEPSLKVDGNIPTNDTSRTGPEVDQELQSRWATMNLGVSRFRKHLEITSNATESDLKSPPPPDSPFSSSSESGSGKRQRLKKMVDESLITYRRSIFKSLPNSSYSPSDRHQTIDYKYLSKDRSNEKEMYLPNTTLDDIMSEKIEWAGVSHLSDTSSVDLRSMSLQQASFSDTTSFSNASASGATKYSSLGPEGKSLSSGDFLHVLENSSQKTNEKLTAGLEKMERRGLSALKVMSQERKNWDGELGRERALELDAQDGNALSHVHSEKVINVFSQQSQMLSRSASETKKEIDLLLLYGVPRYKRHSIGDSLPDVAAPRLDD